MADTLNEFTPGALQVTANLLTASVSESSKGLAYFYNVFEREKEHIATEHQKEIKAAVDELAKLYAKLNGDTGESVKKLMLVKEAVEYWLQQNGITGPTLGR